MSRILQCNEGISEYQLWPTTLKSSLNENSQEVANVLEKVPHNTSGLRPVKTKLTIISPVFNSDVSPTDSAFPRSFTPFGSDEIQYSKKRLDELLISEKDTQISEESSLNRAQENQKRPNTRSISDPELTNTTLRDFGIAKNKSEISDSPDSDSEMARADSRSFPNDVGFSYYSKKNIAKNSQDVAVSSEITNLIAAAGSAEAVISYLLKEKQTQTAQNTQLWRLVDKQRAMILGLNKDLERSIKDKERYRKKIKDISVAATAQISILPTKDYPNSHPEIESNDVRDSSSGSTEEKSSIVMKGSDEKVPDSPMDFMLAPYPVTPKYDGFMGIKPDNLIEPENQIPSPSKHAFHQDSQDPASEKHYEIKETPPNKPSLLPKTSESKIVSTSSVKPKKIKPIKIKVPSREISESDNISKNAISPHQKAPPVFLNLEESDSKTRIETASDNLVHIGIDQDVILDVIVIPENSKSRPGETSGKDGVSGQEETREEYGVSGQGETREEYEESRLKLVMETTETKNSSKELNISHKTLSKPTDEPQSSPLGAVNNRKIFLEKSHSQLLSPLEPLRKIVTTSPRSIGLPQSPRPVKSNVPTTPKAFNHNFPSVNSPPMSPTLDGLPEELLSSLLATSASKDDQNPLLPSTPMSIRSVAGFNSEPLQLISPKPLVIVKKDQDIDSVQDQKILIKDIYDSESDGIYKGLVSKEYPGLLLPPDSLAKIDVKVASSRLKPSRASMMFPKNVEEDPVFTLALFTKSDDKEIWRVEKDLISLIQLDQTLKQYPTYNAKFPDKSLFNGHAPAKVDARRVALKSYLESILENQLDLGAALEICKYFSSNALGVHAEELGFVYSNEKGYFSSINNGTMGKPLKNGYLTKRGKNFGGWKARYFILDGPVLQYYESPGGPYLGAISLRQAQIGKQAQSSEKGHSSQVDGDEPDSQYRHAFLILEPKRKDSSNRIRHVLCAESDLERDQWVDALCQYIEKKISGDQHVRSNSSFSKNRNTAQSNKIQGSIEINENLSRATYSDSLKSKNNNYNGHKNENSDITNSAETNIDQVSVDHASQPLSPKTVTRNTIATQGQAGLPNKQNNPLVITDEKMKYRKRSFFGFGGKTKTPHEHADAENGNSQQKSMLQGVSDQAYRNKSVFGVSLADAVKFNHPVDVNVELPAVVYRCIEYLDAKNASIEEGIFRLSGSNVVIRQLRERFDSEKDVNLVIDDQYYDIHAVASLLKLYLRELPTTILTRELHLEFIGVTQLTELNEKISALYGLVSRLPSVNKCLLRYLSSFLINIIRNSDVNKMTVRNVGIVFSPTLNIPATVFSLFLQQYTGIFGEEPDRRFGYTPESSSSNSLNGSSITLANSKTSEREYSRAANQLAGPTFNKSIGASKTYQQNISENSPVKVKRRDSSLFSMNMVGLGQRNSSVSKNKNIRVDIQPLK